MLTVDASFFWRGHYALLYDVDAEMYIKLRESKYAHIEVNVIFPLYILAESLRIYFRWVGWYPDRMSIVYDYRYYANGTQQVNCRNANNYFGLVIRIERKFRQLYIDDLYYTY